MKILVVTYENRDLPYKQRFRDNHSAYCKIQGYMYKSLDICSHNVPPYWAKVFIVADYIHQFDWVIWIDSDAEFATSDPFPLESNVDFVISKDKPQHRIPAPINTGVFAIKNSPSGLDFMESWKTMYNPTRWTFQRNTWVCNGKWSGEDYEQGSCWTLIKRHVARVSVLPWYTLNNHAGSRHKGTVHHYCGSVGKRVLRQISTHNL